MLTLNRRDFIRLHEQHPRHAGIIACTFNMDFIRQANRIHTAIVARRWRCRLEVLPTAYGGICYWAAAEVLIGEIIAMYMINSNF